MRNIDQTMDSQKALDTLPSWLRHGESCVGILKKKNAVI